MNSYKKIKNKIEKIEALINKVKIKEAKELYILFEKDFKKWLKEVVLFTENCFKNESIIDNNLFILIQKVWFDAENLFFDKTFNQYIEGKEAKVQYEATISKILKILNLKRIKFWKEVEELFDDIITVLDFIENEKFRREAGNQYINNIKKTIKKFKII
jgi:hypothetical protein